MKNKILKDEQLEQVAGGTSDQVGKDIDFMHTLKSHSNEYYVNGERIPRMKTLMFIMNKLDKDFDIKRYL